jgi:hypothetical protein
VIRFVKGISVAKFIWGNRVVKGNRIANFFRVFRVVKGTRVVKVIRFIRVFIISLGLLGLVRLLGL